MPEETSELVSACFSGLQHSYTSRKCCRLICLEQTLFTLQEPCSASHRLSETMTMQFPHLMCPVKESETPHAWSQIINGAVLEQNIQTYKTNMYCTNIYMYIQYTLCQSLPSSLTYATLSSRLAEPIEGFGGRGPDVVTEGPLQQQQPHRARHAGQHPLKGI